MAQSGPPEARVIISSPSGGLEEYREKAIEAIQRMSMRPIVMEHLVSDSRSPLETSLSLVDEADIYVGILAFRYGSYPEGKDRSFTEFELDRAKEKGIDILILEMDEKYNGLSANDFERDPERLRKLTELKARLRQKYTIRSFTTPDNFCYELVMLLSQRRREAPKRMHGTAVIPIAPKPYIAHPYSLLDARRVIGRQDELSLLTDWIAKRDSEIFDCQVLNLVAIGGMGKSALTWKWFKEVVPNEMPDIAGCVWWSFYERDASFEVFLTRVLAYITGRDILELQDEPMKDRVEALLYHLDQKPYLLVLDGLERLLNAYAKLDAARMEDADLDRQTDHGVKNPIGQPSLTKEAIGKHYLRMASDSYAQEFLRRLGAIESSKVLITTRLFPADMQEESGDSMAGTRMIELKGLKPADAIELWRGFGNSGSRESLLNLFESFEYYPLLMSALAGLVRDYRPAPGNFDRWLGDNLNFDVFGHESKLIRKRILDFAIAGLDPHGDLVLRVLSAFLMPASYDDLARLLVGPRRPIESEEKLHVVLSDLEDRGLVGWDRSSNHYDLHPVVRGMTWARLPRELRRDAHLALRRFYSTLPIPLDEKIKTFDDLAGKVQEYDSMIGLGDFDEAATQFEAHLQYYTRYRLKAFRQRRELLLALLRGNDNEARFKDLDKEMYGWYRLGETDVVMGRCRDAIPSLRKALAHFTATNSKWTDDAHYYLGIALAGIGRFRESINELMAAAALRRKKFDLAGYGDAVRSLAGVASEIRAARFDAIAQNGLRALQVGKPESSDYYSLETLFYKIKGDLELAEKSADMGYQAAIKNNLGMGEVATALRQGEIALLRGNLDKAEERFLHAVREAREGCLYEDEVLAQIGMTQAFLARGNVEKAEESLAQARSVLKVYSMLLAEIDARNTAAKIALRRGQNAAAFEEATEAYRLAWCEGPPYAYVKGLEEARAILEELGADLPENLQAFSSPMHLELDEINLDEESESASQSIPGITNTVGWSDEQVRMRYEKVREQLDWTSTTGSAKKWWVSFEEENNHRIALALRLAEELANRKATITEFFLAYVYSNTENIQANLHYLDYSRLKKEEERRKKEAAAHADTLGKQSATDDLLVPSSSAAARNLFLPPGPGISDIRGWSDEQVRNLIEKVKEKLDWKTTTGSARKWWEAFETENAQHIGLVLRLAEELESRKATITEFFLAVVYSNTENIQANLHYLDYTRLKKEEERRKKESAAVKAEEEKASEQSSRETPGSKKRIGVRTIEAELPLIKPSVLSGVSLESLRTQTWLLPGISSTNGWSEETLRKQLVKLSNQIEGDGARARNWWQSVINENEDRLDLVIRLAEELASRKTTVEALYQARQECKSRKILAILSYLDYTRSRGGEANSETGDMRDPAGPLPITSWLEAFPDVRAEPNFINCPHCQAQIPLANTCRACQKDPRDARVKPLLFAATSSPASVRNTFEWTDAQLNEYHEELQSAMPAQSEEVRSWWSAFRSANADWPRYQVRLLEEVLLRGASLRDLHQAFQGANTLNLVAILHFMDYNRRLAG